MTDYVVTLECKPGLELRVPVEADSPHDAREIAMEQHRDDWPDTIKVRSILPASPAPTAPNPFSAAPAVARIVHFQIDPSGPPIAAMITAVHPDGVSLTAFQPDHLPGYVRGHIPQADAPTAGHWNWPPRV